MRKLVGVKGNRGLAKDLGSNAVININNSEIQRAKEIKATQLRKKQEEETLRAKVDSLESDVSEIKSLLKQILEKQ